MVPVCSTLLPVLIFCLSDFFLLFLLLLYFIFINYEYCFKCHQLVLLVLNSVFEIYSVLNFKIFKDDIYVTFET